MKNTISYILVMVLCISVMLAATATVMATEEGGQDSASSVSTATSVEQDSSSSDSSSTESDLSSSSSNLDTNSNSSETSSDQSSTDSSSSDSEESSSESSSSEDSTSSGNMSSDTTSSTPQNSGGITSAGAGGGHTFIDETGSAVSGIGGNESTETSSAIDQEDHEDFVEDEDHYETDVTSQRARILRWIWIPSIIAALCIAALVYVNIKFRSLFKTGAASKKSATKKGPAKRTVNRRK